MESMHILVTTFSFAFICSSSFLYYYFSNKNSGSFAHPTYWPVLGMIPSLLSNLHRFIYWVTEILQHTRGTFLLKGPWFCKVELLFTADPTNVQYIMSKRHHNFHKGDNFTKIFDIFGDGIFNSDSDKWEYQRKIALSTFTSTRFRQLHAKLTKDKTDKGLIPFLERAHKEGLVVDLQHIFQSLISDITYMVMIGIDSPNHSFSEGLHEGEEAVLLRHLLPEGVWKLQRWLRIGKERKLSEVVEAINSFFYEFIRKKRVQVRQRMKECVEDDFDSDLISLYIEETYDLTPDHEFKSPDIFLRDTFLTFLLAGQDTVASALTWFFWLLIKHPNVENKIREELIGYNFVKGFDISQLGDANKLVYLHAALFETLRLYPPVPFNHRASKQSEVLPSGHQVKPWTKIILATYAIGRMKSIWGEDCEEFKPERWITEQGTIKHEPSHKFFAFNSGPRICLGKEMSMMQLKAVACSVLYHNYRFEVVEGHGVEPKSSVVLQMKHGLKVRVYNIDDQPY